MLITSLLPILISLSHAAPVVTPSLPAPVAQGSLRVNGTPSLHRGAGSVSYYDGVGRDPGDLRISGQGEEYSACPYKVRDGRAVRLSMETDDCQTLKLNREVKLQPGPYLLLYHNSVGHAVIQPGTKTVIEMRKIQAPELPGGTDVKLRVNLSDRIEQDKQLFYVRVDSTNRYAFSHLDRNPWARDFVSPYLNSGDPAQISQTFRDRAFSTNDEYCGLTGDNSCTEQEVGAWSSTGYRQVCRITSGMFGSRDCKSDTFKYKWSSAYFLVFPGVYTMIWSKADGEESLKKTGIRVD